LAKNNVTEVEIIRLFFSPPDDQTSKMSCAIYLRTNKQTQRFKSYSQIDAVHSLPALKPLAYKRERVLKQATFLTNLTSLMPETSEPICNSLAAVYITGQILKASYHFCSGLFYNSWQNCRLLFNFL